QGRYRVYALTRNAAQHPLLRARGVTPILGDLDDRVSLSQLAGLAQDIVHLAPPPPHGAVDERTANLLSVLRKARSIPQRFVYLSTSGVYGDCAGEVVFEHRALRPQTDRARRRVDAERQLRRWGRDANVRITILRVPGIYAADRLPIERLRNQMPAIRDGQDGYTNHIHADDLARAIVVALARGGTQRAYNTSDGDWLKMGAYFDLVADRLGLPRPPRLSMEEARGQLSEASLSFMRESRRLDNGRIRRELRLRLRYPSVLDGIAAVRS
ncbi:MAG TPA: NAD-dependent epimerase/dehydratase family protein, partial [Burkholderiales bacterium]|nr:NAD-dependent epimerase/dehydratase family protein [Burkholderiales bacterium]